MYHYRAKRRAPSKMRWIVRPNCIGWYRGWSEINRTIKSTAFSRQGHSSLAETVNNGKYAPFDDEYTLKWVYNQKFSIIRDDGSVIQGSTDAAGKTGLQHGQAAESLRLRLDGDPA
ncbi:hypothetical protein [Paraburkholderia guartelaensis]|uniref:hypothetical protein n=1 Tax=Paraburkholderia guartelaensis TaxID=2546446 RepID=UPI001981B4E7|nr:hypothetical protein [Paraburkholderia guartelaensis]